MKTLKLSDISKKYNDITVLANANAEFTSSKITCIRGQSGAGKTTLLNIIMGVEKTDKGIVEFVNDNGQSVKPGFSAVFQDCRLIEHLSPVINVKMVLKKNKKNSAKKQKVIDYYKQYIDLLLLPGESEENFSNIYQDAQNAYSLRKNILDNLYKEIKNIKKLNV